jgi:hypothetical protein
LSGNDVNESEKFADVKVTPDNEFEPIEMIKDEFEKSR